MNTALKIMLFFTNIHRYQVVEQMGVKEGHHQLFDLFQTNGEEGQWGLCQQWNMWSHWSVSTIQKCKSLCHCLGYNAVLMWHLERGTLHITGKNTPYVCTFCVGVIWVSAAVMMQKSTKNSDTVHLVLSNKRNNSLRTQQHRGVLSFLSGLIIEGKSIA